MSSRFLPLAFAREILSAVAGGKLVWLLHVVLNALLLMAFFYWTRIPESTGWQFAWTVTCGLGIAFVTLWLHSGTFGYFASSTSPGLRAAWSRSLARIPAFLAWTLIFGLVLWLIGRLWDYDKQIGGWVHHLLPLWLRRRVAPKWLFSFFHGLTWFLYFFLWPILFLPVGAQVATRNFHGFFHRAAFRPVREVRFWLLYLVCFVLGAYLPHTLASMVPEKPSTLAAEVWSMIGRLGLGYLLLVTAWIVLCAAIMRVSRAEGEGKTATLVNQQNPT